MSDLGLVLRIHRGSLHDGPGIRTTVFLKGCPLRCRWCHNPESQAVRPQLAFRAERCSHCAACVGQCAQGAQVLTQGRHRVDYEACLGCAACVAACPSQALECYGERLRVEECLAPVLADRAFYQHSGGGLTVSGGEPLAQAAFTAALLAQAQAAGVHTCLETSGHAPAAAVEAVLPFVDLVLFDCKASDETRHRELTGVGLERIHWARERFLQAGIPLVLRCPLIPGMNDDDEHLRRVAAFAAARDLRVEIMPYHVLGQPKRQAIGYPEQALPAHNASAAQLEFWKSRLLHFGCERVSGALPSAVLAC